MEDYLSGRDGKEKDEIQVFFKMVFAFHYLVPSLIVWGGQLGLYGTLLLFFSESLSLCWRPDTFVPL